MRIPDVGAISVFASRQAPPGSAARSVLGHALTQYLLRDEPIQPEDTPAQALLRFVGFAERWLRSEVVGVTAAEVGFLIALQDGTELPIVGAREGLPVSDETASKWNLTAEVYDGPASPSAVQVSPPT